MFSVKIYGAGSIGNHLAFACRNKNWDVLICDIDPLALERTKNEIYPSRYKKWDDNIQLSTLDNLSNEKFDLVIIGTPPDTHIKLAIDVLKNIPPKVLLIEKPLCTPSLTDCDELAGLAKTTGTFVGVGYNHTLTKNTLLASEILKDDFIGWPLTISVQWLEYWGGIFSAHPWLDGPKDTYLGFSDRGGGACGEHSHAINIWQHFSHLLGMGRIIEVSAVMDMVEENGVSYDRLAILSFKTEKGLIGNVVQDVITEPSQKSLRIQGTKGFLEWWVNLDKNHDAVKFWNGKDSIKERLIEKTRPDDFKGEIDHVEDILKGNVKNSPISLERGIETMKIIAASHKSNMLKKSVDVNYNID